MLDIFNRKKLAEVKRSAKNWQDDAVRYHDNAVLWQTRYNELAAELTTIKEAVDARRAKLSEAGRKGALVANLKRKKVA